ncbi:hypothetical protein OROGR_007190 [Orobanche gracilis]
MPGTITFSSNSCFAIRSRRRRMFACASVAEMSPFISGVDNRSLYEVLRVRRDSSQAEIKTAYRALAKLYHPDAMARFMDSSTASSADDRDFINIRRAYATLSDPDARAVYDFSLKVTSGRRRSNAAVRGRFYPTQRWETDQCW